MVIETGHSCFLHLAADMEKLYWSDKYNQGHVHCARFEIDPNLGTFLSRELLFQYSVFFSFIRSTNGRPIAKALHPFLSSGHLENGCRAAQIFSSSGFGLDKMPRWFQVKCTISAPSHHKCESSAQNNFLDFNTDSRGRCHNISSLLSKAGLGIPQQFFSRRAVGHEDKLPECNMCGIIRLFQKQVR